MLRRFVTIALQFELLSCLFLVLRHLKACAHLRDNVRCELQQGALEKRYLWVYRYDMIFLVVERPNQALWILWMKPRNWDPQPWHVVLWQI